MDLFNQKKQQNILPFDGEVIDHGLVLNRQECNFYYQKLWDEIPWENDQAIVFGKHYITKRKVAWFGDKEYNYTYSGVTKQAHVWTQELLELKSLVEKLSGTTYNSCLLNLYHDGSEGMAWHSDGEKTLLEKGTIASLTLGAERKFSFKHKETKQRVDIILKNGSLLLMKGETQKNWLHRLPPTKKVHSPRINLTFRTIML
ncbi:alpha-ketoglutarate-dependent dioxygenase AlkB family protein [Pseudotenacibaculum haliotis]|uniref:Alpha-ketoglutarate-dependent dioxygenase AlkB family protein n=1 Tax=Pseudotenacibaculum haliotis TaxID=1862138 RepID=A0ABW5LTZ2_9FLAO